MMLITRLLLVAVSAVLLCSPALASSEVWDVLIWDYLRVYPPWSSKYTEVYTGGGADVYLTGAADYFLYAMHGHGLYVSQRDYENNANTHKIRFTLDGSQLSLSRDALSSEGGSSETRYALRLFGTWAALGSVSDGVLVADPFATFVSTGYGNGFVEWAANTPAGYSTQLLLGYDFEGNGAVTRSLRSDDPYSTETATMFMDMYAPKQPVQIHSYRKVKPHTFTVTYNPVVPEPSTVSVLAAGLGWAVMVFGRKRE